MISLNNFEISVPLPQPFLPTNSFASELLVRCRKRGKKVCFVKQDGSLVTYNDVATTAESVARFLQQKGVQQDDTVCLLITEKSTLASILLGCLLHSTLVILACDRKHAESIVSTSKPTALIHDSTCAPAVNDLSTDDSPPTLLVDLDDLDSFECDEVYAVPSYRGSVVTQSLVVFSGGSDGSQRGVVLPDKWLHYWMFLEDYVHAHPSALFENKDDVVLLSEPLWRFPGLIVLLSALSLGCTAVIQDHFDPLMIFELIEKHKITCLPLSASSMIKLASVDTIGAHELSSVQSMVNLGGALPSKAGQILCQNLSSLGYIRQFYCLTECAVATRRRGQYSVLNTGKPLPGNRVKMVKDGQKCSLKVHGEIHVVGECMFSGYFGGKKLASEVDKDGWFPTGDIGFFDEQGNIHVLGRKLDAFTCAGESVSTVELEDLLLRHPSVERAAVIGVPSAELGECARAFIVPRSRPEDAHSEAEGIRQFVRLRTSFSKQLHGGVEFLRTLPTTEIGLPIRKVLRTKYLSAPD